ncbi:MAG: hypothetical protein H6765_00440 [Candidatus Peribacteria bacterium]|nr:MAG: hypothetical protein H6765_00440 [Candidatus Peribacteria bacterium]
MQAILKHTKHTVVPLYITKEGKRICDPALVDIKKFKDLSRYTQHVLPPLHEKEGKMILQTGKSGLLAKNTSKEIDLLRNVCHGEN